MTETCIEYCMPGFAYITSDERRYINAIHRLAKERSGECIILAEPQTNDGFIYAKFPQKWVKIRPPRENHEDPEKFANRMKKLRELQKLKNNEGGSKNEESE